MFKPVVVSALPVAVAGCVSTSIAKLVPMKVVSWNINYGRHTSEYGPVTDKVLQHLSALLSQETVVFLQAYPHDYTGERLKCDLQNMAPDHLILQHPLQEGLVTIVPKSMVLEEQSNEPERGLLHLRTGWRAGFWVRLRECLICNLHLARDKWVDLRKHLERIVMEGVGAGIEAHPQQVQEILHASFKFPDSIGEALKLLSKEPEIYELLGEVDKQVSDTGAPFAIIGGDFNVKSTREFEQWVAQKDFQVVFREDPHSVCNVLVWGQSKAPKILATRKVPGGSGSEHQAIEVNLQLKTHPAPPSAPFRGQRTDYWAKLCRQIPDAEAHFFETLWQGMGKEMSHKPQRCICCFDVKRPSHFSVFQLERARFSHEKDRTSGPPACAECTRACFVHVAKQQQVGAVYCKVCKQHKGYGFFDRSDLCTRFQKEKEVYDLTCKPCQLRDTPISKWPEWLIFLQDPTQKHFWEFGEKLQTAYLNDVEKEVDTLYRR